MQKALNFDFQQIACRDGPKMAVPLENALALWGEPERADCADLCHGTQTMNSNRVCDCQSGQLLRLHMHGLSFTPNS